MVESKLSLIIPGDEKLMETDLINNDSEPKDSIFNDLRIYDKDFNNNQEPNSLI